MSRWAVVAAVASGLLLAAAFPPLEWSDAAWFALVPLLLAVWLEPSRAFRSGWIAGLVFWLISIFWLTRVTVPGWFGMAMYCALYTGAFAWLMAAWFQRFGVERLLPNLGGMLLASVAWVGLEYIRSVFATGFPWNPLAVSQYRNLVVIQLAALGGVWAVSGLIVWMASGIGLTFLRYLALRGRWGRRLHLELFVALLAFALTVSYGMRELRRVQPGTPLRVTLVQVNIPQDDKWSPDQVPVIYERLSNLTASAVQVTQPDLVVWPETALPDDVRYSEPSYQLVHDLATNGVPLLVGSMDTAWGDDGQVLFFNSAFLFDGQGAIVAGYDKRHLVPFGEYIPLRKVLPFMKAMTPIQESFSSGSTSTVFALTQPAVRFSSLICFEDTLPWLARESVRNGARLLVNQTNDGWFDPLWASRQHMAHCVFRCVENRVPAVRAANTGVSCHIDAQGRVRDLLTDDRGGTIFHGFMPTVVSVPGDAWMPTLYHRVGDCGVRSCAWAVLGALGLLLARAGLRRRREVRPV